MAWHCAGDMDGLSWAGIGYAKTDMPRKKGLAIEGWKC